MSFPRLLATGVAIALCNLPLGGFAATYGQNVLVNGGAEDGTASSTGDPVPVPGWTTTSAFTVVNYGAPGGFPATPPTGGGAKFFAGGNAGISAASQDIDVSANAADIDSGSVFCDVSGYLGGYADQLDDATFTVFFRQNAATDLGSVTIGPVTPADRSNNTRLLLRTASAAVPAQTRTIHAVLTMTRRTAGGTFNDGYADVLSVVLRGPAVVTSTADSGAGSLRDNLTKGSIITFSPSVFPAGGSAAIALTSASFSLAHSVTIDGSNAGVTIDGGGKFQIFNVTGGGATVTFKNLNLVNGRTTIQDGAAIRNLPSTHSALVVDSCKFSANETAASYSGGAIATTGATTIRNCEFDHNRAGNGGALFAYHGDAVTTISNCNFHDNATLNTSVGEGGAILLFDGPEANITASRFTANLALSGGAIYMTTNTKLTATITSFDGNIVTAGSGRDGGAIHSSGVTLLDRCTLNANKAPIAGGVYADAGTFTATASTFTRNTSTDAASGGALDNVIVSTLTNCTLALNTAPIGGAIRNKNPGTLSLTNCTIALNSATNGGGGGIATDASITLNNTLVANNAATGPAHDISGNATGDYNLITDATGLTFSGGTHNITGKDPLLDPSGPKNNGGPTDTIAVRGGSVAIDAANTAIAPATDQRGFPRVNAADIGAYEFAPAPAQLLNLSTRKQVGTGDNVTIGGFIVVGTDPKKVILRGLGPSLPVGGALADPTLELHDSAGNTLAVNDNWQDTQGPDINATGIPPSNNLESAILQTLTAKPPEQGGAGYTAVLAGKLGRTGIGLLELYDLGTAANSKLANISTRGFVGGGDDVLIGGFIPGPTDRALLTVLIRGLGPSLPVSGALQDPVLELHDGNGNTLLINDNWRQASNASEIQATGVAPSDDRESAILTTIAPSNSGYTAVLRGVNGINGVGLVELYALQ